MKCIYRGPSDYFVAGAGKIMQKDGEAVDVSQALIKRGIERGHRFEEVGKAELQGEWESPEDNNSEEEVNEDA